MIERRFVCLRCEKSFVIEVLEPGEAEAKRIRPMPVRCPQCGGPVQQEK